MIKKCRECENEIIKQEGVRARKFYCSFICYQRFTSKAKYYKNHTLQKERAREKNRKQTTKDRYKLTISKHKQWCKDQGLTTTQYGQYGYLFLKNNPEVVKTLLILNNINSTKQSDDEVKEYKKSYYLKNRDKILKRQKETKNKENQREYNKRYREKNKEKLKQYSREWYIENADGIKCTRKEYNKRYREKNKEKLKQQKREWYLKKKLKTNKNGKH